MRIDTVVNLANKYLSLATTSLLPETDVSQVGTDRVMRAYHGSSHPVRRFDRGKTVDGTFWFSEDVDKILRGESGAAAVKWLASL